MRWLCRIFDHAWTNPTTDPFDAYEVHYRRCLRCDAQEWTTTLRSPSPPDTSPEA